MVLVQNFFLPYFFFDFLKAKKWFFVFRAIFFLPHLFISIYFKLLGILLIIYL